MKFLKNFRLMIIFKIEIYFLDKNQHLADFVTLIKNSNDLQPLFESVQRDTNLTVHGTGDVFSMDQS